MMLSGVAPCTTRVVNVAFAPSTASAATEVTSFVVEAGVKSRAPSSESSTRPVAGSATTADTWGPSAAVDSGPARADRRPLAVGSEPSAVPGTSTVPAPSTWPAATVGTRRAASRGGSMRATVMPAASVNTFIMASVSTAAIRVRRTMTYHLRGGYGGRGASPCAGVQGGRPPWTSTATMELITQTGLERTSGC